VNRVRRRDLLALAALLAAPSALAGERRIAYIQPLGKALPDLDVAFVRRALLAFYAIDVRTLARAELPKSAYYPKRARYRAEKLLAFLVQRMPSDGYRILGLTGVDISTTKGKLEDWGILGLATLDGAACLISSFRTKRRAKNAAHARARLGKTAVHEIGHTFGLDHCPNRGCLMEDGRGSVLTTDREYDLCTDCRTKLIRAGHELSDSSDIPWPKP
jgi:archaemetzincin